MPIAGLAMIAVTLVAPSSAGAAAGDRGVSHQGRRAGNATTTRSAVRSTTRSVVRGKVVSNFRVSSSAINTSDRAAVSAGYQQRFVPSLSTTSGWTGSSATCDAGTTSSAVQQSMLAAVNYARSLNGLDPVTVSARLSAAAQQAALIMAANNDLSHEVPTTWRCFNDVGASGAASSNLVLTSEEMTAGEAVSLYLADPGSDNGAAGHRRWLMNPIARRVGVGMTTSSNAYDVLGAISHTNADPAWTSWPSAGYFPSQLEPAGRWSLSSGDSDADFSRAQVSVVDAATGAALPVTIHPVANHLAMPTLVFEVAGLTATGTYRVRVTGISGARDVKRRYQVTMFTA